MLTVPVFKAHLHVEVIPGEGVIVLSDQAAKALHGNGYEYVVRLIDGRHSTDEIVDALSQEMDPARVYYALNRLEAAGYLTEAAPDVSFSTAAFWHGAGIEPAAAQAALREKRVSIQAIGEVDVSAMTSALQSLGVQVSARDDADLWLVLTDDYLRAELSAINDAALQSFRPWLLSRGTGREMWVGPLFQPGETGCWMCLRKRLERNRAAHRFVAQASGLPTQPFTSLGSLPVTQAVTYQVAAVAAVQFLAGAPTGLAGKVLTLDWSTHSADTHQLVRHPHCAACGRIDDPVIKPLRLLPAKVGFVRDGGHRSVSPETTLKKYGHLVSPITGVVRMLAPVRDADGVAHVYLAGHNDAIRLDKLAHLKLGLRNRSCGKGMSEAQAKVSALSEAIERYSGEFTGAELRVTRALRDWKADEAYHPNDIMLYSSRQYAEREIWNRRASRFNHVPERLPDDVPIDWTPLWSLTSKRHKYLPTQFVYYHSRTRGNDHAVYAMACSNGNAAGNTLEEAILQGFLELVERDAVALWWYNQLSRPGVEVDTFGEPYLLELSAHYRECHRRATWALDLTSDLGIPVFAAISKRLDGPEEQLLFGLGCHLDARIALQRAFTEMNQMLGLAHAGENGEVSIDDVEPLQWLREATLANKPYMAPDTEQPVKRYGDYPVQHSGDLLQDIDHCRRIIESQGMEMLVLDQTRADVGMPVVKVVVPGLRHFWARFAPGRLYDVPVKMGWLKTALREEELNPVPVFI
jgi:ribosomal protein S12 methylthiotransferase accessory factor